MVSRQEAGIENTAPAARAKRMADLGVNTLICGAISAPLETMLLSAEVRVIAHACGPVEQVLRAFLAGRLPDDAFLMPGCGGLRRRHRGRRRGNRQKLNVEGDIA